MTATTVNGLAVIADEPTDSPISRNGKPVVWTQTRTLLLEDGSTIYGCLHCDYTHTSVHGIRPHLRAHATAKPSGPAGSLTLDALLAKVEALGKVESERDEWRKRALKAEKSLATLRNALRD